jgi:hypothetical protein
MLRHPVDNIGIFGVHHRGDAKFPSRIHDVENLVIQELQWLVCHVQLHTRNSELVDHLREFILDDLGRRIGDDDMESVVAVGLVLGELVIILDNRDDALVLSHLGSERDHCCRSSSYRTARARIERVADKVFRIGDGPIRNDRAINVHADGGFIKLHNMISIWAKNGEIY